MCKAGKCEDKDSRVNWLMSERLHAPPGRFPRLQTSEKPRFKAVSYSLAQSSKKNNETGNEFDLNAQVCRSGCNRLN